MKAGMNLKKISIGILVFIFIIFIIVLSLNVQRHRNNIIVVEAVRIVEAIKSDDMEKITQLIFPNIKVAEDERLLEYFPASTTVDSNKGIISCILRECDMEVIDIDKKTITYKVTAPYLENIFQDIMEENVISEEEFKTYIYNYIEQTDRIEQEVEVPYAYKKNVFQAEYASKEFLNVLTGNFL